MTIATYTITETAATSVARQIKIGVRAKSGSSIPSKAADWKGSVFPVMTFDLAAGATTATATIETVGNTAVDGNREFEFYEVSRSPSGGTLSMNPSFGTITDDDTVAPVVVSNWAYSDDFEDAAVGDDVMARPNWVATGASPTTYKVSTNKGMYNSGLYRGASYAQFGPSLSDDFGFEVEVDENRSGNPGNGRSDSWAFSSQGLLLYFKDADNHLIMADGEAGRTGIKAVRQSGTTTSAGVFFGHRLADVPAFVGATGTALASQKRTYQIHNGKLRIRLPNGEWALSADRLAYPFDMFPIDTLSAFASAAARVGKVAWNNATWVYDSLNGIRVRPLKMVITSHARYCSRRPNTAGTAPENFGRIWVKGDYAGTATRWAYRLNTLPIPKTVAQDWRDCADVVAANGQFSVNCQVPFGFMGEIELAMTDSDGVTHTTTTKRVACGKFFIFNGQSNSTGRQGQASGLTVYSQKAACRPSTSDSNSEGIPSHEITGLGTIEHSFANVIEGARMYADVTGIPCLILATGIAGSGIVNITNEPNFTNTFGVTVGRFDGWVDGVGWDQGEGDRDGAYPNNSYFDNLDTIYQKMVTATGNPNLPMWISPIGRFASTDAPSADKGYTWAGIDAQAKPIFAGYQGMIDKYPGKVRYADSKLGQRHNGTDTYHYSSAAYQSIMRRFARSVLKSEGQAVPGGRGPLVTSVVRSGPTLTLPLDMNGATGLTDLVSTPTVDNNLVGTPAFQGLYGYQVSTDNFATTVAISSIAAGSDRKSLVITLAADPGKAVQVRSFFGASYDDRQLFWGTYDGGFENVPVFPIYVPLTSN